ncbi:AraC family transcriptional regulator [Nocardia yamanashiensis]|uniref:AraC family transcriptional regulator n=1 Tax=Nocardia yamanashiensis TaxID=209247 RepID=UPI001E5E74DC|nr:AraC family transcriptional regulator [Nocardia yamanashiensis]UGT41662.1 AraC family transcriptional regulator [Nocardia yamanashiensis]
MDPLSNLLSGIRAEGSVVAHAELAAPWTIRFGDRAPLTMITVLRGGGTLLLADGSETPLRTGDTAIVRGPELFHLADRPESIGGPHTEYEIACFTPEVNASCGAELSGISWGADSDGTTALIVGAYQTCTRRHERLLRALPAVLVISEDLESCAWMEAAVVDAVAHSAGSQAMMDRLLDWGLVCTLRTWFAQAEAAAPTWYRGLSDPVVAPALEAIHGRPGVAWTVAALAAQSGVSRALFAKRFTAVMGEPPLAYLTACRMDEAEDLLIDAGLTVAQIARSLGYADAFGFSAAFKRHKGMSPTAFRAAVA